MVATPPGDYGSGHIVLNFHGSMPGGEIWSCGLRTEAASPEQPMLQLYADYAAKCFERGWKTGTFKVGDLEPVGLTFNGVTCRVLDIKGVTQRLAEGLPDAETVGLGPTQGQPNQCALAITLLTNKAGRHGKGRVFFPALNAPLAGMTGKMQGGMVAVFAGFWATLISDLNTIYEPFHPDDPLFGLWAISVQSRTSGLPGVPVVAVAVGDVVDTQRRRRNKLLETYQRVEVVPMTV